MELQTPLPPNLRKGLTTFSGSLFINNKTRDCGVAQQCNPGHKQLSSLPLQMMLYFHTFFLPFWCLSEGVMLELKYSLLPTTAYYYCYQFLLVAAYLTLILVESLRLYLGYIGNLQEKVPELAGFLLLSILIELPTLLFMLTDLYGVRLPLETAVHLILLLFLASEIIAVFFALRAMTKQLAMQFYRRQFEEDLEGPGMLGQGARGSWRSRLPVNLERAPLPAQTCQQVS
ncbi:transmembrane protein 17B-like [Tiliqua scincoides]|uniref:transmembrane protein 17B-like n=1 Tax=Tiliqua scincoides TaxID=71010 RepID=UPI003463161B